METTNITRRALKERIKSLELENCQYDPRFFASQEGNTEGGSSRGGSRRLGVPMMYDLCFYFSYKTTGSVP